MAVYSSKLACLALVAAAAVVVLAAMPCAAQKNLQQEAVDLHNDVRDDVGVGPVTWDDTVAAYAESYAEKRKGDCALKHSDGTNGENLFWASAGTNLSAADVMASWESEKQWYDHDSNTCSAPADKSCGHYTQVVWAKSTAIGCAAVDCDNDGGIFVTCNYNPPGNVDGQSPY